MNPLKTFKFIFPCVAILSLLSLSAQDKITLVNGKTIDCKITEVESLKIAYSLDGVTYRINKVMVEKALANGKEIDLGVNRVQVTKGLDDKDKFFVFEDKSQVEGLTEAFVFPTFISKNKVTEFETIKESASMAGFSAALFEPGDGQNYTARFYRIIPVSNVDPKAWLESGEVTLKRRQEQPLTAKPKKMELNIKLTFKEGSIFSNGVKAGTYESEGNKVTIKFTSPELNNEVGVRAGKALKYSVGYSSDSELLLYGVNNIYPYVDFKYYLLHNLFFSK